MATDDSDAPDASDPEAAFDEWATKLSQAIDLTTARLDLQDQWQMGLVKLCLIQEFRFWRMVGDYHQKNVDKKVTDEKRDHAAALAAFDHFLNVMPPELHDQLRKGRDGIIEMLMDAAGHQPRLN